MPEHPNAAAVRTLFEAFEKRDIAAATSLIADDAVWRFPGKRGRIAGEHRGHPGIIAFLAQVMAFTSGTFHLELHDVTASDDHVVVLFTGHGERNGKQLNNPTCLQIRMENGRVAELWEFVWDLEHVEDFWS